MLLRCLKAELQKCRRSPVWLAFLVLPIFPAILGTGNYLSNLDALGNGWYSLWSQHTLFSSMFFLPALLGVFCSWQWRLEHTDHNWNSFLTAPVPVRDLYAAKLILAAGVSVLAQGCIGVLFLLSGKIAGLSAPIWCAGRGRGLCDTALFEPHHPCLCPAGGLGSDRRHCRSFVHGTRSGLCLSLLAVMSGHARQQPPDGTASVFLPALCADLRYCFCFPRALVSQAA